MPATACFRISGDYLTGFLRDLCLGGDWRRALDTLTASLKGADEGTAFAILRGDKALTGVNDFALVGEDPAVREAYRADLLRPFAGVVRTTRGRGGGFVYMKPYARVTNYGACDVDENVATSNIYVPTMYAPARAGRAFHKCARAVFYMDDRRLDRAIPCTLPDGEKAAVLWAETLVDPPPWVTLPYAVAAEDPAWRDAVHAFLSEGHTLAPRGASAYYKAHPERANWLADALAPQVAKEPRDRVALDKDLVQKLAADAGLSADVAEGMAAVISGEADAAGPPSPSADLAEDYGWVTGDGRFFGCRYFEHRTLAARILRHEHGVEPEDPDKHAGRLNWVKIGRTAADGSVVIVRTGTRTTSRQQETVEKWAVQHQATDAVPAWNTL